ncbi:MAG: hypothetical protein CMJ88_13715 [Planctomycetes bacterium]|nr:hypothetical protein [Planctomycetota bacterium]
MTSIAVADYPDLDLRHLQVTLPERLAKLATPTCTVDLLAPDVAAPLSAPAWVKPTVRDLLRHRGYRPTGRGKPSSEYLAAAAAKGTLGPINAAVDCGNAVSLHSGIPISVVDVERTSGGLSVDVPGPGNSYVFNRSGQTIDVAGLLCLFDGVGPCANAVKDAQRTKTDEQTSRLLVVLWAPRCPEPDYVDRVLDWLSEQMSALGASVE